MKKISLIKIKTISFIIIALLMLNITIFCFVKINNSSKENIISSYYTPSTTTSQENDKSSQIVYKICSQNGIMTVLANGEEIDIIRKTIFIENLPSADQELIEAGIFFDSYSDMILFIEDYE